jgi:dinuclear metal center YbgI/SA1388 family protein
MRLNDFISVIEGFAPVSLALEYDNVGLLIGTKKQDIQSVLVALDCTEKVAEEAAQIGADLVLTHHPVFFKGIKRILPDDPETCAAYTLIRHGIALYAAHTNLDAAAGGVNDVLAGRLGLRNVRSLPPEDLGRIGDIPVTSLYDFAQRVEKTLDTRVSVTGYKDSIVKNRCGCRRRRRRGYHLCRKCRSRRIRYRRAKAPSCPGSSASGHFDRCRGSL